MSYLKVEVHKNICEINKDHWNNLVEQSKLGSFFHRYEWLKSIEQGKKLEGNHIIVMKDRNIVGILPNFVIGIKKTPFNQLASTVPGFGGPIIIGSEKEVLDIMLKTVSKICRKNIISHCITTLDFSYVRYNHYLIKNGYIPNLNYCRFIIYLNKNIVDIKSEMDKSKKSNLKKAHSNDFIIKDEKLDENNLKDFYKVYIKVMEKVGGDAHPLQFFLTLKNNLQERMKMFGVFVKKKQVGRHLYFLDKEQSSLHHFFSAIEESNFKYHPSELLHEYAIKWGINNNYKRYDFGGTGSKFNDGLFKFKEEFGGQVVPTLTWEKGYSHFRWTLFKIGRYIYNKSEK